MENQKDRFGETMRLVEKANEDIFFAERDLELLEKLRSQLKKNSREEASQIPCPKCTGKLDSYTFEGIALDRCRECEGIWLDRGELEAIIRRMTRGPLGEWLKTLTGMR